MIIEQEVTYRGVSRYVQLDYKVVNVQAGTAVQDIPSAGIEDSLGYIPYHLVACTLTIT